MGMDTGNLFSPGDTKPSPGEGGEVTIEPLKPKRPSRTVREVESLLAAFQVGISTDMNQTKEEILQHVRDLQSAVEAIARELARRLSDPR